jgi:glycosyltransferase involved in cell wall biosynthesis
VPVLVHTKHGRNKPNDSGAVAWNRRLSKLTDAVVAVSRDAAAVATEIEKIPAAKVQVIHNGVDAGEPLAPMAWEHWQPRAITVARLDPVKNLAMLLHAARRIADSLPGFHLDVVGDGPERSALEALAGSLRLSGHVSFLGYRRDVRVLLRRAQIFVLTSATEGIALTLLEAMAAGLPAVVTDVGGNREVVQHEVTGALVPPGAVGAFADVTAALARQPDVAHRWGAAGRSRLEAEFDLRRTTRQYADLYRQLLGRRVPSALRRRP